MRFWGLMAATTLCVLACGEPGPVKTDVMPFDASSITLDGATDGGVVDGGLNDTGVTDAAPDDSGPGDTGADAGPNDTGPDAGPNDTGPDAGPNDTGPDAGPNDTGPGDTGLVDAGQPDVGVDAGIPDSGDAGAPNDAGFIPTYGQNLIDNLYRHGQAATVVDFENDGDLDVLASMSLTDGVRLHLNSGTGATWTAVNVATPGTIVAMHAVAADLDNDGDRDVVAAGLFNRAFGFGSPGEVTWYRNDGNNTFVTVPITGQTFWGPRHVETGDLTGDGLADVAVGALQTFDQGGIEQGHGVYYFRNTGGNFAGPTAIDALLLNVEVVIIRDVDGDGVDDVIASGGMSNEIVWYENLRQAGTVDNTPAFTKHQIFAVNTPSGLAFGQADADADLELFATGATGLFWLDPPANPRGLWTANAIATNFGTGDTVRIAAGDINQDGRTDVAISAFYDNSLRVYLDDPSLGWLAQIVQQPYTGVTYVSVGDVDGDLIPDLVTSTYENSPTADRVDWWRTTPP